MKKTNLAFGEFSDRNVSLRDRVFREVNLHAPDDLPVVDLVELYAGIEFALSAEHGLVVQFVGATSGFGSEQIALDMAWASSSVLGKKILLVNCTKSGRQLTAAVTVDPPDDEMTVEVANGDPEMMVKVVDQELYLADLRSWHGKGNPLSAIADIDGRLEEFRGLFDMIILMAPPADTDPFGAVLARHVDGNVMILEAERTRRSAAIRLRQVLARSGRPIVGTVLNNRRDYIPRWLARFL